MYDIQMKFMALKLRMKKIKVAKLATRVKSAAEKRGIKTYVFGHAIPQNVKKCNGSVLLTWKKKVEGSLATLHGAFDPNIGLEIETYLESRLADNRLTAKEFWRRSEWILKNALIDAAKEQMHEDIAEGDDDDGGFAVMLNVKNKKFIAADWGKYKAVMVSKCGNASLITENNNPRPTISDLLHFRFRASKEGNSCVTTKEVKPGSGDSVILASHGIWEVMGIQEAGHLILS